MNRLSGTFSVGKTDDIIYGWPLCWYTIMDQIGIDIGIGIYSGGSLNTITQHEAQPNMTLFCPWHDKNPFYLPAGYKSRYTGSLCIIFGSGTYENFCLLTKKYF